MERETKEKIKGIVENYKRLFPDEYHLVIEQIKQNRKNQMTKFGELKGKGTVFVERALIETPETLNTMFNLRLTDDEKDAFREKQSVRWFAETFPVFKLVEKI